MSKVCIHEECSVAEHWLPQGTTGRHRLDHHPQARFLAAKPGQIAFRHFTIILGDWVQIA